MVSTFLCLEQGRGINCLMQKRRLLQIFLLALCGAYSQAAAASAKAHDYGHDAVVDTRVYVDAVQFSAESVASSFPMGMGPTGPQRMILGCAGRQDTATRSDICGVRARKS